MSGSVDMRQRWLLLVVPLCVLGTFITSYFLFEAEWYTKIAEIEATEYLVQGLLQPQTERSTEIEAAKARLSETVEAEAEKIELDAAERARLEEILIKEEGEYFKRGLRDGADLDTATLKELFKWTGYIVVAEKWDCELPFARTYEDIELVVYWGQYMRGIDEGMKTVGSISWVDQEEWVDAGRAQAVSCEQDASEFVPFLIANTSFFN